MNRTPSSTKLTEPTSGPAECSVPKTRWPEIGLFVVLLLVAALTLSKNQPDPDFWGHVQYGRDVLATGLPRTITYSYSTLDHPWINHEILSELLMALGVNTLGAAGVLGLKCLAGLALVGAIMVRAERNRGSLFGIATVVLLVSVNLMHFWTSRPQLLSYLFFALLLLLLAHSFRDWPAHWYSGGDHSGPSPRHLPPSILGRMRWLWLAPPLLALWANAHGGFVAGFCVLAVYLSVRGLEAWLAYRWDAWPLLVRLAAPLAASGMATLLNPYGFKLHAWLWGALSESRPEIIEWRRPELFGVAWLPWWVFVTLFVALLLRELWRMAPLHRRSEAPTGTGSHGRLGIAEWVVLLLTLWQAIEHRRNIPFFVIAFGIWLPASLDQILTRLTRFGAADRAAPSGSRRCQFRFGAALVVVGIVVAGTLYGQLRVMPVMKNVYPVSAFQYMADQGLRGRLVTRFMWAQYAIAAFGVSESGPPEVRLAFDGRFRTCYPQELVDMYFDFALGNHPTEPRNRSPLSPPIDGSRILRFRNPDLVLLDRHQPHPLRLLAARRDEWVMLYQDRLAQLWGRAVKYGDPQSPDFVPPEHRHITEEAQSGFVPWPALPVRNASTAQTGHVSGPSSLALHRSSAAAGL